MNAHLRCSELERVLDAQGCPPSKQQLSFLVLLCKNISINTHKEPTQKSLPQTLKQPNSSRGAAGNRVQSARTARPQESWAPGRPERRSALPSQCRGWCLVLRVQGLVGGTLRCKWIFSSFSLSVYLLPCSWPLTCRS